jgi:hypothetical protein
VSVLTVLAQVPQPVLKITPTGTNQFLITVTNGVTSTNYEIYRAQILSDPLDPWVLHMVGTNGQTNFVVDMGIEPTGWFRAAIGSDQDGDGIQDWIDGNPNDGSIGALSITIDSPTNGMTIN